MGEAYKTENKQISGTGEKRRAGEGTMRVAIRWGGSIWAEGVSSTTFCTGAFEPQ